MSISRYRTFLEVAKTESMSKAAQNTHQTVPGISYAITKMEEEFGFPLFVRNRSSVVLSEAGIKVKPYVEEVLCAQEKLEQMVLSLNGIEKGIVKVGGLRNATKLWLPDIMKEMEAAHPGIHIEIVLNLYEEIKKDLLDGTLDVAFGAESTSKMLEYIHLMDDPYVVVYPVSHSLQNEESINIEKLRQEKLIMPDWSYDKKLKGLIDKSELGPQIIYYIKDVGTILSMVESRIGIAILPKLILEGNKEKIGYSLLEDWPVTRFGMVTSGLTKPSPAAKTFIQCVKKYFTNRKR